MPRPQKKRKVQKPHMFTHFTSKGFIDSSAAKVSISIDEMEAIRLADLMGCDHAEAAERMNISRSTFTRLIERARNKTARLFIEGKELTVSGGNIEFSSNVFACKKCNRTHSVENGSILEECPFCGNATLLNTSETLI